MSRPRRSRSLIAQLSALPVAIAVPALAMAAVLLYALGSAQQSQFRRDLQNGVHAIALAVDGELAGATRELERIADSPLLRDGQLAGFHRDAGRIVGGRRQFTNLVLFDLGGRPLVDTGVPWGRPLTAAGRSLEERVVTSGQPAVSDLIPDPSDGAPSVALAVPVKADGVLRGVLTAQLDPAQFSRLLGDQPHDAHGIAAIVDRQQRVIARRGDAGKNFDPAAPDYFIAPIATAPRGAALARPLAGEPILTAWETLPSGWIVAVGSPGIPRIASFSRSNNALIAVAVALLALAVVAAVAARVLARRARGQLLDVSAQARRLSAGETIPMRRFGFRELEVVDSAMRDASKRLAELRRDLDASEALALERRAALEEAERRRNAFLAMLAHELRNPLAPLRAAAETLKAQTADPRLTARAREVIARQVLHLGRLIDDLLDISRATQGTFVLQTILLDLRTVVSVSVHAAVTFAVPRQQAIEWQEPHEPVWVEGDLARLTQIVDTLLANALKFSPPGGRIDVRLDVGNDRAELTVHDDGAGIPPELLDRVFEMFVQGDDSLDRASGADGLGLTLVRELARLHGGDAQVASATRGHGTSFAVWLPLATRTSGRVESPPASGRAAAAATHRRGRVLIVDDNQDAAEALAWIVEPLHDVQVAHDGRSAVDRAQAFRPDVVLLDIGLPVLNGYQVAEELRKSPDTAQCVIIAITGYGQSSDRERALQSGFDFHLVKPAEPTQVLHMIDEALQHRNESSATD
jgi:signal transduction histidine kinase/ActR/RegA family two-component response regulator